MKQLKPYYIYGKLNSQQGEPSIHIVPKTWQNSPKGYFPIEIINAHNINDALIVYCDIHKILIDKAEIEFKPIPSHQATFLDKPEIKAEYNKQEGHNK